MGFSVSWLAAEMPKPALLQQLGFRDTDVNDEANEWPFSASFLPGGWAIIWSNDFEFGAAPHLDAYSMHADVISCQIEEHIMFSACHRSWGGHSLWSVWHDAQKGIYDLHSTGGVMAPLPAIAAKLRREQEASGGEKANVDHIFDIPIEVAADVTGFRHDRWQYDWGRPHFTAIERLR